MLNTFVQKPKICYPMNSNYPVAPMPCLTATGNGQTQAPETWNAADFLLAIILPIGALIVTIETWRDILYIAGKDEEQSHIFLVPLVSAWLVYKYRDRIRGWRFRGRLWGLGIMGIGWMFYVVGDANLIEIIWHAGAIVILLGSFVVILGRDLLHRLRAAVVIWCFVIPCPGRIRQAIAIPMSSVSARVTQRVYDLAGEPIDRSGNVLIVNGVDVGVAEACNGMRLVMALFLVSFVVAFGDANRWGERLITLAVAPVLALACNIARLAATVYMFGYHSASAAKMFHDLSGWGMLVLAFVLQLGILRVLRWALIPLAEHHEGSML